MKEESPKKYIEWSWIDPDGGVEDGLRELRACRAERHDFSGERKAS